MLLLLDVTSDLFIHHLVLEVGVEKVPANPCTSGSVGQSGPYCQKYQKLAMYVVFKFSETQNFVLYCYYL